MTYAGWDMSYRSFQQNLYIAVGGETTIPNKGVPESVLYRNGLLLNPGVDYTLNYTTGVFTLTTPAVAGHAYQVLNLSVFRVADTYTRAQADDVINITTFTTATNASPVNLNSVPVMTMIDMDCSSGSAYATLPSSPKKGLIIRFRDKLGTVNAANRFTVKRNGGTGTIMGIAEDMDVTVPRTSFSMTWNGTDWRVF